MSGVREDCYWYGRKASNQRGCGLLTRLQCKVNGRCSFYETVNEYEERQRDFENRNGSKIKITSGFIPSWEREGMTHKEFLAAKRRENT